MEVPLEIAFHNVESSKSAEEEIRTGSPTSRSFTID